MLSAFLQLDGTLRHALSELAGVGINSRSRLHLRVALVGNRGERRDCIVGTREMSVTCLFFSPNKLIDYSPTTCIRLLTSTRYLHTSVKQTHNLRSTFILHRKPPLLDYQLEAGVRLGVAKNKTRGLYSSSIANLLSLYGGSVL